MLPKKTTYIADFSRKTHSNGGLPLSQKLKLPAFGETAGLSTSIMQVAAFFWKKYGSAAVVQGSHQAGVWVLVTHRCLVQSAHGPFTQGLDLMILVGPIQPRVFCDLEIKIMCEIRKKGQMQGNTCFTEGSPIPLFPKSLNPKCLFSVWGTTLKQNLAADFNSWLRIYKQKKNSNNALENSCFTFTFKKEFAELIWVSYFKHLVVEFSHSPLTHPPGQTRQA